MAAVRAEGGVEGEGDCGPGDDGEAFAPDLAGDGEEGEDCGGRVWVDEAVLGFSGWESADCDGAVGDRVDEDELAGFGGEGH